MPVSLRVAYFGTDIRQHGTLFIMPDRQKRRFVDLWRKGRVPKAWDIANNFDGTHSVSLRTPEEAKIVRRRMLGGKWRLPWKRK